MTGPGVLLREDLLDGEPVRWLEHGEGAPVVLVHGIPTSSRLWRHVLPLVRGRCLALEMRGYGSSIPDEVGRNLGLAAQADRLLRWLEVVGVETPVLVGHDLGGGVEYGRRLAADLGSTLQPIPGGKHFTSEDHPEVIAAAVNELLPSRGSGAGDGREAGPQ